MSAEIGQLWMERNNGLFLLTDIVKYRNNVHLYKLYSFKGSCMIEWSNPFGESVPPNFTVL